MEESVFAMIRQRHRCHCNPSILVEGRLQAKHAAFVVVVVVHCEEVERVCRERQNYCHRRMLPLPALLLGHGHHNQLL